MLPFHAILKCCQIKFKFLHIQAQYPNRTSMSCRLYLAPYETTPTYRNVHNKFSVTYMLNLVLVDEEDRRYFKQQEIVLYRTSEEGGVQIQSRAPPPFLAGGRGPSSQSEGRPKLSTDGGAGPSAEPSAEPETESPVIFTE